MNLTARFRVSAVSSIAVVLTLAPFAVAGASTPFAPNPREVRGMDIDTFWTIIDRVHARAGANLDLRIRYLEAELSTRSLAEIQAFQAQYDGLIVASYRWDLWGAAYVMNGGCSDDGFRYFRDWLISEGRHTFESAMKSPDSLAELPKVEMADNELFGTVAFHVYEARGGGELDRDMSTEGAEPQGAKWHEADLPRLFPRLAKKYQ